MPYVASNNGLTVIWHDPSENYQLQTQEIVVGTDSDFPTVADLSKAFPGYAQAVADANKPPPPPNGKIAVMMQDPTVPQSVKDAFNVVLNVAPVEIAQTDQAIQEA